jgi:hypothetical protein
MMLFTFLLLQKSRPSAGPTLGETLALLWITTKPFYAKEGFFSLCE